MSDEYLGVIGHRKPRESRVGDGIIGYEYEPVEEVPPVAPPAEPPARKPRLFYLLEQVLGQLGLLTDEVTKLRPPEPIEGVYYNSGIQTIATETDAPTVTQPAPPDANYPNKEKVFDTLGRTATITIINLGLGYIYALVSSKKVGWTTREIVIGSDARVPIYDAYEIALRTNKAGTQYQAIEYPYHTGTVNIVRSERVEIIKTVSTRDFTGALAQNEHEMVNLPDLIWNKLFIRGVNIQTTVNNHFRAIFWSSNVGEVATNLDDDTYLDHVDLDVPTNGFRIWDGAAFHQYYLEISGLGLIYEDDDDSYELHVSLQNLSVAPKPAAANVQLDFFYAPRL